MKIGIIGGGAAGIMAALAASKSNHQITILEQKDIIGKKITATGNGRCNYTNMRMEEDCYRGDLELLKPAFDIFSRNQLIDFFQSIGIFPHDRNGYIYPYSDSAASVRKALELALKESNVEILTLIHISEIKVTKQFEIRTNQGSFVFDKIIVCTGLKASPQLGSDGSFFDFIHKFGHHFTDIYPALVGFEADGLPFEAISGVRAFGKVSLYSENNCLCTDSGEIQFTDYGLSGIPIFQVSSYAVKSLGSHQETWLSIDLFPDFTEEELKDFLVKRRKGMSDSRKLGDYFLGLLQPKLSNGVLSLKRISQKTKLSELEDSFYEELASLLKSIPVQLIKSKGFENAQVCTGGILSSEIETQTLESKLVPGLYFAGEILNVDGKCGGYNLQWAFSSGYLAGASASQRG